MPVLSDLARRGKLGAALPGAGPEIGRRDLGVRLRRLAHRFTRQSVLFGAAGFLAGCAPAGAPSLPFFGAYFPSWLACALAGILGAVLVRLVFVRIGVDDALPFRLPIYVSIAAGLGFLVSLLGFGR